MANNIYMSLAGLLWDYEIMVCSWHLIHISPSSLFLPAKEINILRRQEQPSNFLLRRICIFVIVFPGRA